MTFIQLEVFLTVVKTMNFTKAGELLNMSQSAVSHAISSLEEELGVMLIERNRKRFFVTEVGERVLKRAKEILYQNEKIAEDVAAAKGYKIGTVRIGCFSSVAAKWIPGLFKTYHEKYPDIQLKMVEGTYDEIVHLLLEGDIDCGFITLPNHDLVNIPLFRDELKLVVPCSIRLTDDFRQVEQLPFIMPNAGCQSLIEKFFKDQSIQANIQYEIRDTHTIVNMVKANIGCTILPELAIPEPATDVHILSLHPKIYREIGLAVRQINLSPAVGAFIEHTKGYIDLLRK